MSNNTNTSTSNNFTQIVNSYKEAYTSKLNEVNAAFVSKDLKVRETLPALVEELNTIEADYRDARENEILAECAQARFPFVKLAENHRFATLSHAAENEKGVQQGYKESEKIVYVDFFKLMRDLGISKYKWGTTLVEVYQHFFEALKKTHSFEDGTTAKKLRTYTSMLKALEEKAGNGIDISSTSQLKKSLTAAIREILAYENTDAAPVVGADNVDITDDIRMKYTKIEAIPADVKHIEYCITARSNNVGAVKLLSVDKFFEVIYDVLNRIVTNGVYKGEVSGTVVGDTLRRSLTEMDYGAPDAAVNPFA